MSTVKERSAFSSKRKPPDKIKHDGITTFDVMILGPSITLEIKAFNDAVQMIYVPLQS